MKKHRWEPSAVAADKRYSAVCADCGLRRKYNTRTGRSNLYNRNDTGWVKHGKTPACPGSWIDG